MAFFKLLRQSPLAARIGLGMILINVVAAIFAPLIAPYGETEIVGDVWLPPSSENYLGTDHLGRDLFTRLVYGARNTILIAFITTMLAFFLGAIFGFFAATLEQAMTGYRSVRVQKQSVLEAIYFINDRGVPVQEHSIMLPLSEDDECVSQILIYSEELPPPACR